MDLLIESKNLTFPCVIPNCLEKDINLYHQYCLELLGKIGKYRASKCRVWINGRYRDENLRLLYDNPPVDGESILHWASRLFKSDKFGIVLNNVEYYHDDLNRKIQEIIDPLIRKLNIPSGGLDIVLFIGNYGFTPFGIHKDYDGGKILHLHLGPGDKNMFLWDDQALDSKTINDKNRSDVQTFLPTSTKFSFKASDLFFMPEDLWHVGETNQVSAGLAIRFNHNTRTANFKELFKDLEALLVSKNNTMKPHNFLDRNKSPDIKGCFTFALHQSYKKLPLERLLFVLYEDKVLSMRSNGGFYNPPIIESRLEELSLNRKIKAIYPFKIQYKKLDNKQMFIFVRSYRHTVKYNPAIIDFIKDLNRGKTIPLPSTIKGVKKNDFLKLVAIMYQCGGVELV